MVSEGFQGRFRGAFKGFEKVQGTFICCLRRFYGVSEAIKNVSEGSRGFMAFQECLRRFKRLSGRDPYIHLILLFLPNRAVSNKLPNPIAGVMRCAIRLA